MPLLITILKYPTGFGFEVLLLGVVGPFSVEILFGILPWIGRRHLRKVAIYLSILIALISFIVGIILIPFIWLTPIYILICAFLMISEIDIYRKILIVNILFTLGTLLFLTLMTSGFIDNPLMFWDTLFERARADATINEIPVNGL